MNYAVRHSDTALSPHLLAPRTATSVPGGAVISSDLLQELARLPDAPGAFVDLAEAIAEQENLYAMATLSSTVTGIVNLLIFIPAPQGPHGPRIKVAIDPQWKPGGTEATVPFDVSKPASGPISGHLERQVRQFIRLNLDALLEYWNLNSSTDQFIDKLRPVTAG